MLDAMRRAFSRPGFSIASEAWPGIDAVRRATALRPDVKVGVIVNTTRGPVVVQVDRRKLRL